MAVRRIVSNIHAADPAKIAEFYRDVFGLDLAMDLGWIVTLSGADQPIQVSAMSEGGSGTAVPALSIEVDNLDETLARLRARGQEPEYGPADEPWGVRRFYLRDPAGTLVNVLAHTQP